MGWPQLQFPDQLETIELGMDTYTLVKLTQHRCQIPVFISHAHALLEKYVHVGLGDYSERFEINRGYQADHHFEGAEYILYLGPTHISPISRTSLPPEMKMQQLTKHLNDYSQEHASLHDYYNHPIDCFEHTSKNSCCR